MALVGKGKEKAKKVAEITGVKTIVGSLEDTELLTQKASEFDVVLQIVRIAPFTHCGQSFSQS